MHTPDRDRANEQARASQPETANSVVELLVCVVRQLDQTIQERERALNKMRTEHNESTNERTNQPTNE